MKKLFLILSLIFVLTGCKENKIQKEENVKIEENKIIKEKDDNDYEIIYSKSKLEQEDLGGCFIKKNDGIYDFDNKKIEKIDLASFEVLGFCYAKDKNHIYHTSKILNDVDLNSFEVEKRNLNLAKDKNNFYFSGEKIDVDYLSFEILSESFAKDKNGVYYIDHGFEKMDLNPKSTILFGDEYIKDNNKVFCNVHGMTNELVEIKNADAKTFDIFEKDPTIFTPFAKDKNSVYYNDEKILKADVKTFQILKTPDYAKDKNNCYGGSQIVPMSECEDILRGF